MKSYFAYIRVSTVKQGEHGSSLHEQKAAIEGYAARCHLTITRWFEEMETAAKQGRRMFNRMLAELERERAAGVIIHKIDRSARNLKDWAHLGELIDHGIEVHFVHDNLDLNTRGGRLSADIQAVVASDYIRNLREEVRKGFYGRLKQGFYPLPAPRGYLDQGKAKPKVIDPVNGPLIREVFSLYSTGAYSVDTLRKEMHRRGLRTNRGEPLSRSALAAILHNPFYIGLIHIRRTDEIFAGQHEPLISKADFERAQAILLGRAVSRTQAHRFVFRRLVRCARCGHSLTGERQKGHVYYRCHGDECKRTSITEQRLDAFIREHLALLQLPEKDIGDFRDIVTELIAQEHAGEDQRVDRVQRDLALLEDRLHRLTDAFLDGSIDKALFDERKRALLFERSGLLETREKGTKQPFWEAVREKFELGNTALPGYESGTDEEKREILKSVTSNLLLQRNEPVFPMVFPYAEIRNWAISNNGGPRHALLRKNRVLIFTPDIKRSTAKKSPSVSTLVRRINRNVRHHEDDPESSPQAAP